MSTQSQQSPVVAIAAAPSPPPPMSFGKQLIAGGFAGILETLVMYPTDVVKTRVQLATTHTSLFRCIRDIAVNDGIFTFYRGITSPILAEAPKRAVKFSCNEYYKQFFTDKDGRLTPLGASGAGLLAGWTEVMVNCPFEVVKIRMQAAGSHQLYKSTFDCAQKIIRQEGLFRGLYQGLEAQLFRNGIWNAAYFGIIDTCRRMIPLAKDSTKQDRILHSMATGCVAGSIASCLNTPFDVAKSRIQNQKPGDVVKYKWAIPTIWRIGREEGVRRLYAGLIPKLIRLGPGGAILLVAYDLAAEYLRRF